MIVAANEGPVYRVVGDEVRVLASSDAFEVFELRGPENSGPPPHTHPWHESYFVVEGEVDVMLNGNVSRVTAGGFVSIPPGTAHCYRIATPSAKFLVLTSPSGAGAFFEEMDRETRGGMDMATIVRVAGKHSVVAAPR